MKTLLALGAGGVFLSAPVAGRVCVALAEGPFTFESFVVLSTLVTMQGKLDIATAHRIHDVLQKEPGAPDYMAAVYAKLSRALRGGGAEKLTEGEAWFADHLLKIWYLGIYYHESSPPLRLAYDTALMFRAGGGVIPVPLLENAPFGSWAEKPA